jgi:ketosteroid isomerase-like protein
MDADSVYNHHAAAFAVGDTEEALTDYAADAVLVTGDGPIRGHEALREAFAQMFETVFKPGTYDMTVDAKYVQGDVVFIVWHASCATIDISLGAETYVVRDGKIVAQTFAGKFDPK